MCATDAAQSEMKDKKGIRLALTRFYSQVSSSPRPLCSPSSQGSCVCSQLRTSCVFLECFPLVPFPRLCTHPRPLPHGAHPTAHLFSAPLAESPCLAFKGLINFFLLVLVDWVPQWLNHRLWALAQTLSVLPPATGKLCEPRCGSLRISRPRFPTCVRTEIYID